MTHLKGEWDARYKLAKEVDKMRRDPSLAVAHAIAIERQIAEHGESLKVVIGASGTRFDGWVSTEQPIIDVTNRNCIASFFDEGSVSAILAEQVIEHIDVELIPAVLKNMFWMLSPGGHARIAVPDGFHPDPAYIDALKPGGSGLGSEDHKALYDIDTLSDLLKSAGFYVRPLEWFDKQGEFHFEPWRVEDGFVWRSIDYDERNLSGPAWTSLIVDGVKPC